jgi:hypothetical protein
VFPGLIRDSDLFFAGADVYLLTSREIRFRPWSQSLDIRRAGGRLEGAGGFVSSSAGLRRAGASCDTAEMASAALRLLDTPDRQGDLVSKGARFWRVNSRS